MSLAFNEFTVRITVGRCTSQLGEPIAVEIKADVDYQGLVIFSNPTMTVRAGDTINIPLGLKVSAS